ncbi:MAG: hypothetical protein HYS38_07730 [Acidobacteria bacterium]|nr:hypothetical protein [Acidobacteriota bacterium]
MPDLAEILKNAPRDCWLALTQDQTRVVGRGENIKEAVEEAAHNGENDPVLIWAPKVWVPAVYGGRKGIAETIYRIAP